MLKNVEIKNFSISAFHHFSILIMLSNVQHCSALLSNAQQYSRKAKKTIAQHSSAQKANITSSLSCPSTQRIRAVLRNAAWKAKINITKVPMQYTFGKPTALEGYYIIRTLFFQRGPQVNIMQFSVYKEKKKSSKSYDFFKRFYCSVQNRFVCDRTKDISKPLRQKMSTIFLFKTL